MRLCPFFAHLSFRHRPPPKGLRVTYFILLCSWDDSCLPVCPRSGLRDLTTSRLARLETNRPTTQALPCHVAAAATSKPSKAPRSTQPDYRLESIIAVSAWKTHAVPGPIRCKGNSMSPAGEWLLPKGGRHGTETPGQQARREGDTGGCLCDWDTPTKLTPPGSNAKNRTRNVESKYISPIQLCVILLN